MNPKIEHILHIIRTISIILCIIAGIVAAVNMLIIVIMNTIIN